MDKMHVKFALKIFDFSLQTFAWFYGFLYVILSTGYCVM